MESPVQAAVPVVYVRDVVRSRAFFALFGYQEQRSGADGDSRWSYVQSGAQAILLAQVHPPLIDAELPLLVYLYVGDLAATRAQLESAGQAYDMVGYPDHAPGGEIRTHDPDGNVVVIGQRTAIPSHERVEPMGPQERFSLIKQAAEAVSRRGGAPSTCRVGEADGTACAQEAELKLADTWGATVWACLTHAEEALINAPASFVATEDGQGLGPWLSRRVKDER